MSIYRADIKIKGLYPNMEYYFSAEEDLNAKKWFLLKVFREMKREGWDYDKVSIASDKMKVLAFYQGENYLIASLHCVPDRIKCINENKVRNCDLDILIQNIGLTFKLSKTFPKESKDEF